MAKKNDIKIEIVIHKGTGPGVRLEDMTEADLASFRAAASANMSNAVSLYYSQHPGEYAATSGEKRKEVSA